jgi:hypothetical protein
VATAATVTGAVRVSGPHASGPPTPVTVDAAVCGERVADESLIVDSQGALRNAVVVLRPASPPPATGGPGPEVRVDNAGCRFVPRVQVVRRGQPVRVHNSDPILHNTRADVVGPPAAAVANLALARAGVTMDLTRRLEARLRAGPPEVVVRLGCDVHAWMRGWIVVIDHPYAAITDASATEMTKLMGRDTPKLGALTTNSLHSIEHYGNLVTYLRIKNIVPPTSDPEVMKELMK